MLQRFVAWLRQEQVWGFILSMAVIALIAIAFFYPDAQEGRTLAQYDMVQGAANQGEAQAFEQATGEKALWTDAVLGGMPTFQISPTYPSNSLFSWFNTVFGLGLPNPSNLLAMMMIGFLILCFALRLRWYYALIGAVAWGLSSYFIIIIGAGHIWKFVALSYIPPTIAGLILCYRGRYLGGCALAAFFAMMQLNANHPQMTYYFGIVMGALVIGYGIEAVMDRQWRRWVTATAVMIFAGALAVGANLPSLYNTYEYAKETKRAGSELTPLVNPKDPKDEKSPTGGMAYNDIVTWSYTPSETFSLLIPDIKGGASATIVEGQTVFNSLDRLPAASSATATDPQAAYLLSQLPQYFNDTEGTNGPVYVGAIICALFLLGCVIVRGPVKWVLVIMTGVSILLAWGRHWAGLTDWMIWHFPMYNKFRAVESILVIAEFTMPLLGILALKEFFTGDGPQRYRRAALYTFGITAALCLFAALFPGAFGPLLTQQESEVIQAQVPQYYQLVESLRQGMVSADAWRSLMFVVAAGVLMIGFTTWVKQRSMLVAGVGLLILCDLYSVDKRYLSSESFTSAELMAADPLAEDQADQAIKAQAAADGLTHYRVMDIPGFERPERSYRHHTVGGYHAAKLRRYDDLIARRMGYIRQIGYHPELADDSVRLSAEEQPVLDQLRADYRVMDMLNARYIVNTDGRVLSNPNALGPAWLIGPVKYVKGADAEMQALETLHPGREAVADSAFAAILGNPSYAPVPGDTIRLTSYTPNTLKYEAATRGQCIAVFSEVYFPWGWQATLDGKEVPLARVDYLLRAMVVPEGRHEIVMTFDPRSLHATGTAAYICVTLIYLLCIMAVCLPIILARKPQ